MTHPDLGDLGDVEIVGLDGIPRSGDVHGEAFAGHRVDRLWAVIVVQANGDEGLGSFYMLDDNDQPTARITLVASSISIRDELEKLRQQVTPPEGGRLEWREFTVSKDA